MGTELNIAKIMLDAGLMVKMVLLLLICGSVISWAIIIKKRKQLKGIDHVNNGFLEIYNSTDKLKEIYLGAGEHPSSSYGRMYSDAYDELMKIANKIGPDNVEEISVYYNKAGKSAIERSLKKASNTVVEELDSMLSILASIGTVSPFIGLFGTVWGIIESFHGLASGGGATIEAVAPGIAEALVATAVGLMVAIPAVWFFNFYSNLNNRQSIQMESYGQDVLNLLERTILIRKNQ